MFNLDQWIKAQLRKHFQSKGAGEMMKLIADALETVRRAGRRRRVGGLCGRPAHRVRRRSAVDAQRTGRARLRLQRLHDRLVSAERRRRLPYR